MTEKFNILIVEDHNVTGKIISNDLKKKGFHTVLFKNGEDAFLYFQQHSVDLVVMDYDLPGMSGEDCFKKMIALDPSLPVIFITAYSSIDQAVRLLQMGAFSYIAKPIKKEELFRHIENALEKITLRQEIQDLKEKLGKKYHFENYVFHSENMQSILLNLMNIIDSQANVLITGESGTGKEVIANIIHSHSKRKNQEFIKVNLSALPESLIEVELFGAEKGAYTGSINERIGKFEQADNGTIFLDEIGELPLNTQVKLLRVLQEKTVTKIGSNISKKINFRLITATNKDPNLLVEENKLRKDLYFRLNVIQIELPPLRERKKDLPFLVDHFVKKYSQQEGKKIRHISKDVMNLLKKYDYPGNIRELENIMEQAVVFSKKGRITLDEIPIYLKEPCSDLFSYTESEGSRDLSLFERINAFEKNIIQQVLAKNANNQTKAAKELGISEGTLRYKVKKYK